MSKWHENSTQIDTKIGLTSFCNGNVTPVLQQKGKYVSHHSNFYALPFCSLGHAISKTVSLSSLAVLLPVLVKFLTPPNQMGPPLGWKIWKIAGLLILIAQMKVFGALNATQKKRQLSAKYRLYKNQENLAKMVKNGQNGQKLPFLPVLLFFLQK